MIGWAGLRAAAHGVLPGAEIFQVERERSQSAADRSDPIPTDRADPSRGSGRRLDRSFTAAMRTAGPSETIPVPVYFAAASAADCAGRPIAL